MAAANQFSLLRTTRFTPYFITQCLGALNDNVLRNGLVMLVTYGILEHTTSRADVLANVVGAVFILPYLLFSAPAGQLADRMDKAKLIRRVKLAEIGLAVVAAGALLLGSVPGLVALVFAMGLQSTLFGPIKYAILPDLVRREELIGANGLVEGGTYLAIIVGLFVGGMAATAGAYGPALLGASIIALAVIGYVTSRGIPAVAAADPGARPGWNLWRDSVEVVRQAREQRSVFLAILGLSWFWTFGFIGLAQLPALARDVLNATPLLANLLLTGFAVGIGVGALLCESLSRRHVEIGLVPLGALGMSVFAFDVYLAWGHGIAQPVTGTLEFLVTPAGWRLFADLALIGAFGGLFSVPLYALIQVRSESASRARVVAANNLLNAVFMIAGAVFAVVLLTLGVTVPGIYAVLAVMNLAIAAFLFMLLPEFVARFVAWVSTRLLYRLHVSGRTRVPQTGAVILVANHVSFVDALLIGGAVSRPVRFVMYFRIFNIPFLRLLFAGARAIPIAGHREDPALLSAAYDQIDAALADGQVVCVFPEGAITRDGALAPFRPGIERILERRAVPVIPVGLVGLWGSWFSRAGGGALRKWPRRFRAPVEIRFGKPVPADDANCERLQRAVADLLEERRDDRE